MAERIYEPGISELDYYDILELAYEAKARAIAPVTRKDPKAPR